MMPKNYGTILHNDEVGDGMNNKIKRPKDCPKKDKPCLIDWLYRRVICQNQFTMLKKGSTV